MTGPTMLNENGSILIQVPVSLKRKAGRKEVIVPQGLDGRPPTKPPQQEALVGTLARAFHWKELIDTGKYPSIVALAEALDLNRSHVARILRLTLLAPDIVEAILDGKEPDGVSVRRLIKTMPPDWEQQRRQLTFHQPSDQGHEKRPAHNA